MRKIQIKLFSSGSRLLKSLSVNDKQIEIIKQILYSAASKQLLSLIGYEIVFFPYRLINSNSTLKHLHLNNNIFNWKIP